jgi:Uma2 family endonuclease
MNVPILKPMSVPEFLAWAQGQEAGRHELICGEIVAMAPERSEHVQAKRRAANALEAAIRRAAVKCEAFVDGLAVQINEDTSYIPDALVNCGEPIARDAMVAPHPIIVVEVLSPTTHSLDKTTKLADYFLVPGLSHYLVVDLGRRHVVHYGRRSDGVVTVAVVRDGAVTLDPPGIVVAVSSLFD